MPKLFQIGQIKKLLLRLPVSERQALIRRAGIRSVEAQNGAQVPEITEDILCKPLPQPQVISYPDGAFRRHENCQPSEQVAQVKKYNRRNLQKEAPPHPITNIPRTPIDYDGGVPDDTVTMEIFAFRRRNEQLQDDLAAANTKITRALELLFSLRRFLSLWINEGQGETYDQMHARMHKIDGTIRFLEDRMAGQPAHEEKIPAWKKK